MRTVLPQQFSGFIGLFLEMVLIPRYGRLSLYAFL